MVLGVVGVEVLGWSVVSGGSQRVCLAKHCRGSREVPTKTIAIYIFFKTFVKLLKNWFRANETCRQMNVVAFYQ